jgi:L-threonylcarbamoyladenylate synthase
LTRQAALARTRILNGPQMERQILPAIFDTRTPAGLAEGVAAAAEALARAELVAMPTETVYGLAADATNARAVGSVFLAKGRPRFNPLIVHVPSLDAAQAVGAFGEPATQLAARFWPGPLTLVLPKRQSAKIPDLVTAGLETVAVRVPAHPVAQALLAAFGKPIAAPSANRSGAVSATDAAHVVADLAESVRVVLDAGPTPIGIESTIVGWNAGAPLLLRPGAIPRADLERALGKPLGSAPSGADGPAAPGMLVSHYAPRAQLRLDATEVRPGEALLAFGDARPRNAALAVATANLSESGDLSEAAARFFAALRALDRTGLTIAVTPVPDHGLGEAINDRLRRGAAPR